MVCEADSKLLQLSDQCGKNNTIWGADAPGEGPKVSFSELLDAPVEEAENIPYATTHGDF